MGEQVLGVVMDSCLLWVPLLVRDSILLDRLDLVVSQVALDSRDLAAVLVVGLREGALDLGEVVVLVGLIMMNSCRLDT